MMDVQGTEASLPAVVSVTAAGGGTPNNSSSRRQKNSAVSQMPGQKSRPRTAHPSSGHSGPGHSGPGLSGPGHSGAAYSIDCMNGSVQSSFDSQTELIKRDMLDSFPGSDDPNVVENLKREADHLRKELIQQWDLVNKLQEREKLLQDRLSEQAQRQLEKGSTKFEDLSLGDNRPTQLIKRYGNLYTEARVDALDALDELPEMVNCDDLKVKLLLSIIVLAFRSAQKTLLETKTKIRELLHIPRVMQSGQASMCHIARELEDTIALYLRKTLEKHDLSKNFTEVCDRVWLTLYDYPSLKDCQGLLKYVEECVRIAWSLTVQNPPLVIDYESKQFNEDLHMRFHLSDSDSSEIKTVLWPMLTEGEKGPCVCKGVVLT